MTAVLGRLHVLTDARAGRDAIAVAALAVGAGAPVVQLRVKGCTDRELFDLGGWDDLIEQTQQRYSVWGCAFLEAILRAADGQVSGEGR